MKSRLVTLLKDPVAPPLACALVASLGFNGYFYFIGEISYRVWGFTSASQRVEAFWGILQLGLFCGAGTMILVFLLSWRAFGSWQRAAAFTAMMWAFFLGGSLWAATAAYYYPPR